MVNRRYKVGERDKHKSAEGGSQAIVEGLDVCSTPYLEQRIDSMTPAEAEKARLHMKPN